MQNQAAADQNPTDITSVSKSDQCRVQFLQDTFGDDLSDITPLPSDASFRKYYRLNVAGKSLMLMEDPVDRPDYAGTVSVKPFYKIASHLRQLGLNAPKIHAHDFEKGLMVLDDFGTHTYTRLFKAGEDEKALYELAIDVLVHLHNHPKRNDIDLPPYDVATYLREANLLTDWYIPNVLNQDISDEAQSAYEAEWTNILASLPTDQQTLILRDYHVDNLMRVDSCEGLQKCGLLDFQDALVGPMAYDVMSLLEDARREVSDDLCDYLLHTRYLQNVKGVDQTSFLNSFDILAAQRHAKVLGIFVRLYKRDQKPVYLKFLPHVHRLFMAALNKPALAPLKTWFEDYNIDISTIPNPDLIKGD